MDINNIYNKTYLGISVRYPLNNSVLDNTIYNKVTDSIYNNVRNSIYNSVYNSIYNIVWDNTIQIINIKL
jgi:hypothetical protein